MQLPEHYGVLFSTAEQLKLYSNLVAQLNKDFALANVSRNFSLNIKPEQLKQELVNCVHQLIDEDFASYLNLLYIVDVSETKIRSISAEKTDEIAYEVGFMILQREWMKVWLKRQYS